MFIMVALKESERDVERQGTKCNFHSVVESQQLASSQPAVRMHGVISRPLELGRVHSPIPDYGDDVGFYYCTPDIIKFGQFRKRFLVKSKFLFIYQTNTVFILFCFCLKMYPISSSKPVIVMKFLNIMLAVNLVLLANDVPQNPGPASQMPSKMKGLRVFHLNI